MTCAQSAALHDRSGDQRCGVLVAGEDTVDVTQAIALLHARAVPGALRGGPTLLDELVDADVVVEVCATLAPKLAACQPVGHRRQPSRLALPAALRLDHALVCDDYLFLKYRR